MPKAHFTFGISCHGSHEPAWPNQADLDRVGFARRSRRCAARPVAPHRRRDARDRPEGSVRSCSERELTALATRGSDLLGRLHPRERAALARGYLRFSVDQPVILDVAVPSSSTPFWITDEGFRATDLVLDNPDTTWRIYRKRFPAGPIGLGVNGLDLKPVELYAVFIRPQENREPPHVNLDARAVKYWKPVTASPGASAARDFHKPFKTIPPDLAGAILLQASHNERQSATLARGRVWKTRVVATEHPTQVAIAFGSDPARELVWTWTTSPQVQSTRLLHSTQPQGEE